MVGITDLTNRGLVRNDDVGLREPQKPRREKSSPKSLPLAFGAFGSLFLVSWNPALEEFNLVCRAPRIDHREQRGRQMVSGARQGVGEDCVASNKASLLDVVRVPIFAVSDTSDIITPHSV